MKKSSTLFLLKEKFSCSAERCCFVSICILMFLGCGNKSEPVKSPLSFDEKYKFVSADYERVLQNRFAAGDSSFRIPSSHFTYFDTLKYFYEQRAFQPMFIKSFDDNRLFNSLLSLIGKSYEHGIEPNVYDCELIKNEYAKLLDSAVENCAFRYRHLANLELLLSNAVLKYAYHLRYGVVDPSKIFADSYFIPGVDSAKKNLMEPLHAENILQYLQQIQPKSERYKKLQSALPFFTNLENHEWRKIYPFDKKLKIGEKTIQLKPIIERLASLGFADTAKIFRKEFDTYDSTIAKAVAKFQKANGLVDDGTIGSATVEKLNRSPKEYLEKIKLSLERFRWTNYPDSAKYLLVNIPDFYLRVIENKKEKFAVKICTGRKRPANYEARLKVYEKTKNWRSKPDDWQTPQLYGRITYLILNPTWTVPTSIIREEIYRKSVRDSNYLKKERFKVLLQGKEVDLAEVDLRRFSPNKIPYNFVQDPGAGNALGRIKFMFANKFDIYLHDTPTRAPFSAANRAVSHGCVRVEKPLLLADYVLNNNSKWTPDFVRIEIGQPPKDKTQIVEFNQRRTELRRNLSIGKTTQVNLEKSLPLFIDYFTAWIGDDGVANFRDDVYEKDELLKAFFFSKNER